MLQCYIFLYIDNITREIRVHVTLDTLDLYKQYACVRVREEGYRGRESQKEAGGMKSESEIERYLVDKVAGMGGIAFKFVSPGCSGVPDRLIILPGGKIGFLELKAPGRKPRKEQFHRIRQLRKLGCGAGFADSQEDVDWFLYGMITKIPIRDGAPETEEDR